MTRVARVRHAAGSQICHFGGRTIRETAQPSLAGVRDNDVARAERTCGEKATSVTRTLHGYTQKRLGVLCAHRVSHCPPLAASTTGGCGGAPGVTHGAPPPLSRTGDITHQKQTLCAIHYRYANEDTSVIRPDIVRIAGSTALWRSGEERLIEPRRTNEVPSSAYATFYPMCFRCPYTTC